jgi:DNA-binding MarR family transcriptional regulator
LRLEKNVRRSFDHGSGTLTDSCSRPDGASIGPGRPDDWRAILRAHAQAVRQHGTGSEPALTGAQQDVLAGAFGAAAADVVEIIDAFARGARKSLAPPSDGGDWFASALDMLLHGFDASLAGGARTADSGERPHVIQSELWLILHKVRESAELFYAREADLVELDRRILFLLHGAGPLVPAGVSGAVGVDKAQVSRSVKRLLELRMVEREQIRAPLRLTRKGEALTERLARLADLRNRELTFDIADAELDEFFATIEILLDRAMLLYEQERELAQPSLRGGRLADQAGRPADRRGAEKIAIDRSRIISPIMTLSAYFSRSGALAFKRLTGLSNFEAFVLSEIGINPPITWAALVAALQRDHSQAGRTVKALMDAGLVRREGKPGRRHGHFYPSEEGARLHRVIHDAGRERSAFLLAPLGGEERARFLATVARIRRNAVAQLERERAFAEIDRS